LSCVHACQDSKAAVELPTFLDEVEGILPEFKAKTETMYADNESRFPAKQVYGRAVS
jgi:hypothetical protein